MAPIAAARLHFFEPLPPDSPGERQLPIRQRVCSRDPGTEKILQVNGFTGRCISRMGLLANGQTFRKVGTQSFRSTSSHAGDRTAELQGEFHIARSLSQEPRAFFMRAPGILHLPEPE